MLLDRIDSPQLAMCPPTLYFPIPGYCHLSGVRGIWLVQYQARCNLSALRTQIFWVYYFYLYLYYWQFDLFFFFNTTTTPNMKPKKWVQNPLSLHNPVKQVQTCWDYNVLVMAKNKNQIIHIANPKRVLFTHWISAKLWYMPYFVCMDSFYIETFVKYLISHNKYLEQWTKGCRKTSYRSAQLSLSRQIFN